MTKKDKAAMAAAAVTAVGGGQTILGAMLTIHPATRTVGVCATWFGALTGTLGLLAQHVLGTPELRLVPEPVIHALRLFALADGSGEEEEAEMADLFEAAAEADEA